MTEVPSKIGGLVEKALHALTVVAAGKEAYDFITGFFKKDTAPKESVEEAFAAMIFAVDTTDAGRSNGNANRIYGYLEKYFLPPKNAGMLVQSEYNRAHVAFMAKIVHFSETSGGTTGTDFLRQLAKDIRKADKVAKDAGTTPDYSGIYFAHKTLNLPYPPEQGVAHNVIRSVNIINKFTKPGLLRKLLG